MLHIKALSEAESSLLVAAPAAHWGWASASGGADGASPTVEGVTVAAPPWSGLSWLRFARPWMEGLRREDDEVDAEAIPQAGAYSSP